MLLIKLIIVIKIYIFSKILKHYDVIMDIWSKKLNYLFVIKLRFLTQFSFEKDEHSFKFLL